MSSFDWLHPPSVVGVFCHLCFLWIGRFRAALSSPEATGHMWLFELKLIQLNPFVAVATFQVLSSHRLDSHELGGTGKEHFHRHRKFHFEAWSDLSVTFWQECFRGRGGTSFRRCIKPTCLSLSCWRLYSPYFFWLCWVLVVAHGLFVEACGIFLLGRSVWSGFCLVVPGRL